MPPITARFHLGIPLTALALALGGCGDDGGGWSREPTAPPQVEWVGSAACAECHEDEAELWQGSHHDLAMQPANPETVLGDFDDASFTHFGVTSRFRTREGRFVVETDGPDGKLQEYAVKYAFGVEPLQQYLVEFPGGRLQALGLCWDSRPKEQGGQRWFHLYPHERIPHDDSLHWTGPNQNWNFMCAECHSTDLKKGYDVEQDRFATTWREIDVACEACHGPGSHHVAWAEAVDAGKSPPDPGGAKGLSVSLRGLPDAAWVMDKKELKAKREGPLPSRSQVATCGRCHSRRSLLTEDYVHGASYHDAHRLAFLDEDRYHADGQILDEVYVMGSWLQSRMHAEGVVCSDCHDSHSMKLRSTGNPLCYRCHHPDKYDQPSHHFHPQDSDGALCVACHMPAKTYMVVDPRRDHSMRVPRPDLSITLGTPNACNGCHTDKEPLWAAKAMDGWYGQGWRKPHYGTALHAGREGSAGAAGQLTRLALDRKQPGIARATALSLLRGYPSPAAADAIAAACTDEDPLVRHGAAHALESLAPAQRVRVGAQLLEDPVRVVRIAAARNLADVADGLPQEAREPFEKAVDEFLRSHRANAERPRSHVNTGALFAARGNLEQAEAAYRTALRMEPGLMEAWVNLADLFRQKGDDAGAVRILEVAMALPWVELVAGLALILGIRARAGAWIVTAMLVAFTLGVAQAMARGLDFECGCFGTGDGSSVGAAKLVENVAMLVVAAIASLRSR